MILRRIPNADVGDAFTMLATEPRPDVSLCHGRQVVVLGREAWARWRDAGRRRQM